MTESPSAISELNGELLERVRVYNTGGLHQALGYPIPQGFLECYRQEERKEVMCH